MAVGSAAAAPADSVALGDTAYNALIDRVKQTRPAFTIHVGDVWGGTACQEADRRSMALTLQRSRTPLLR